MATTTATRIGPADNGRTMTLDEFLEADEKEGYRYELARGVLEVTQVPNDDHGHLVWNLTRGVAQYDREHPGRIARFGGASEFRLWLPGLISGRNPDAAVVLHGTPKDHRGRRPASLVMEVVSSGRETRDYETKREEYLRYGIREYWIVDPKARKVTVLIRHGDAWIERAFTGEQKAASVLLPGFEVTLVELWAVPEEEDAEQNPG
jgi:Uma2 family endonuclease